MTASFKLPENGTVLQFSGEGLAKASLNGRDLCIVKHKEKIFACAAKCPHAGGDLSEGYTDSKGNIVCPAHGFKFSLLTGHNVSGEGYFLRMLPVCESSGEITVMQGK